MKTRPELLSYRRTLQHRLFLSSDLYSLILMFCASTDVRADEALRGEGSCSWPAKLHE